MTTTSSSTTATNLERSVQYSDPRVAFRLLAGVQVTLILAITVIGIALPVIQRDLGLRPGQLALISAGYGLAFAGLLLLGGRLADLFRPRRVLVTGLTVFGVASAAAGLAPDFGTLLAARLAQGVGAALAAPAAMALLRSVFPDRDRHARAVAVWGWLAPLGATSGLLLSGLAVAWVSWRWAFVPPAVVGLGAALAAPRLVPAGREPERRPLDVPGAALATAGAVAVSYGLVTAGDRGWAATPAVVGLAVGAAAVAGFVAVESRTRAPLVPLAFVRTRPRPTALTAALLAAAGHSSVAFLLALYFQQVRGMSAPATSAAFLPFAAGLVVAGTAAPRLVARLGPRPVAALGLAVGAVGLLLLASGLGVDTPYAGGVLAGLLVFSVGSTLVFSGATVAAVEATPDAERGLASGLVNMAVELGASVGLAVLVSLARTRTTQRLDAGDTAAAATAGGYAFALAAVAVAFALAAGLVARGSRRETVTQSSIEGESP